MLETSARLLRLLSLLQARRDWTGQELADRLGVSSRTIRTDIDRLRSLGYPVDATSGVSGGYRLGAGATLPPLLLDDDEAVAVAIGLGAAAGGMVEGIAETSVRAMAKLEQILPPRIRHRIRSLRSATVAVPGEGPSVDTTVLIAIAGAIRSSERLRFSYEDRGRTRSPREAEPHRLVTWGRRWYLVAWDIERSDWRTFRVDRISPRTPNGPRYSPRDVPGGDVSAFLRTSVGTATWLYRARVSVHASADYVRARLPVELEIDEIGLEQCVVELGSDSPQQLALYLGMLDVDFDVLDAPELSAELEKLSERYRRAISPRTSG